jgi:EAL domain-containing protein (putative c-di-GMP-specific phosphodiesterase class I)
VAYSHLPMLDQVRPSFLKISQHFGTAFESDPTKMKIVRNLLSLARDFECDLIVEGIEHAATAVAAERLGIKYAQGFYFHRPAEAETFHR